MSTRWLSLVLAVAWLGLSVVPAWAVGIDLKQSGGGSTPLGGTGDAAHVVVEGGAGAGGSGCMATAAAPSYAEGVPNYLSCTLEAAARVTFGLLSGEDQVNQLLQVSGGATRVTSLGAVTSATTSAVGTGFVGPKTFMGQIINATSETKAATALLYGNWTSLTTGGVLLCMLTLPSTVTVLQLQDVCPVITANFPFFYYTVSVYTSASAAPFTMYQLH